MCMNWNAINFTYTLKKKKSFFTLSVNEHYDRLPRDVVKSSFLGIFKIWLDKILSSLQVILFWGRSDNMISRSPFHSVIAVQVLFQECRYKDLLRIWRADLKWESRLNMVTWSCAKHISCDHRVTPGLHAVPSAQTSVHSSPKSWEGLACRSVS